MEKLIRKTMLGLEELVLENGALVWPPEEKSLMPTSIMQQHSPDRSLPDQPSTHSRAHRMIRLVNVECASSKERI
jgi:hypothetical protein